MLWRSNEGKNRPDVKTGEIEPQELQQKPATQSSQEYVSDDFVSREELLASDPMARERYERLRDLRKSLDAISGAQIQTTPIANNDKAAEEKAAAIAAAQKAAADRARAAKAAEAIARQRAEEAARQEKKRAEAAKVNELKQKLQLEQANRREAQKQFEADQKRKAALAAEEQARQAAKKQAAEKIIAQQKAQKLVAEQLKKAELARQAQDAEARAAAEAKARAEQQQQNAHEETMNALKEELLSTHERQGAILDKMSDIADKSTATLNKSQQSQIQELTVAQQRAKYIRDMQRKQLKIELEQSRADRIRKEKIRQAELKAAELAAKREQAEKELAIQRAKVEQESILRKQKFEEHRRKQEEQQNIVDKQAELLAEQDAQMREARRREVEKAKIQAEKAALQAAKLAKAEEAKRIKAAEVARSKAEKQARDLAIKQARAEKQAKELAAKLAKAEEEARIKAERKEQARALWKERAEKRQAARRQKHEAKLRAQAEKLKYQAEKERIKQARRKELDEMARLELIKQEDAAKGGGLVNVHDMTIKTEINKRAEVKLKDLLGIKSKEEKNAATEEERLRLKMDREIRMEEARARYSFNRMLSLTAYRNSAIGKKLAAFGAYCDMHKKGIITISAAIATVLVILAGGFNYCTGYEYSYNGTPLGIVKNKDDVLRITDLVQGALKEDTNMDIVIDAKDDIEFKRVSVIGDVDIDTSDDVLKRLTYMSDFKVSSYGIYVDGKKVGALHTSNEVQGVLENLKELYIGKAQKTGVKKTKVKSAEIMEKIEVKETDTKLQNIYSSDEMLQILTVPKKRETVHTSVAGETLSDIAKEYNMSKAKLIKDNDNINQEGELKAGTLVVIKDTAPIVTVRITEDVTYDEIIKYETKKTKSKDMYKGDEEVTVEGKNGNREVTAEVVSVNGREINREELLSKVKEEPVTKEVTVGTKKRPPTVGDGKFSHPLKDPYHQTTTFRMRWGRFHKGTDMACPTGTPVYAADGGTVVIARRQPSYGNLVVIDHQNGYTTKYAHNSKILVKEGDKVYEGQKIALVGSTGNSTGPHCHFEIRYNDEPLDPFKFIPEHPENRTN